MDDVRVVTSNYKSLQGLTGGPVVKNPSLLMQGTWIQPWSRELRSHTPCDN